MRGRLYIARLLAAVYLLLITSLTLVRRDLSIRGDEISKLLTGPYRAAAVAAFMLLAIASCLIALSLDHPNDLNIKYLLLAYAASVLIAGLTTPQQVVHNVVSVVAFATIPIAMYLNAKGHKVAYAWVGGVVLSLASWPLLGFGLGERLTVYLEVIWLISLRAQPKAWLS